MQQNIQPFLASTSNTELLETIKTLTFSISPFFLLSERLPLPNNYHIRIGMDSFKQIEQFVYVFQKWLNDLILSVSFCLAEFFFLFVLC